MTSRFWASGGSSFTLARGFAVVSIGGGGILTRTSSAGTNPPTWDSTIPGLQDGDTIELYFTTNGTDPVVGTPNETHIADAREEAITWATWPNAFANSVTVKWAMRYGRNPGSGMVWSPLSNILSDVMPAPSTVTGINRGVFSQNVSGSGPVVQNSITIAGNSKIVLSFASSATITSITANSGAITFTCAEGAPDTAVGQVWYADVGSVTSLNMTINTSTFVNTMNFSVDELSNALAGGPTTAYNASIGTSNNPPYAIDGGVAVPTNGIGIYSAACGGSAIAFVSGATQKGQSSGSPPPFYISVGYNNTGGTVTISGPGTDTVFLCNSAWAHA